MSEKTPGTPEQGDNTSRFVLPSPKARPEGTTEAVVTNPGSKTTVMMLSPTTSVDLPTLKTGTWPYNDEIPSPISIEKARRLLVAAYAKVPCSIAGTGIHRYAWICTDDRKAQEMEQA